MMRLIKNLALLWFVLLAVTGCKFFEVQSENAAANPAYSGAAVRTKALRRNPTPPVAGRERTPLSDWAAPSI